MAQKAEKGWKRLKQAEKGSKALTIPAKHPLMIRVRLHMPPKVGRTFHTKRTVIPPVEHAIKVDKAAVPMISPSPGWLIDPYKKKVVTSVANFK